MKSHEVIIIGAGLAGLSSAIHLLDKGMTPLILEARPVIGGRTASWQVEGMEVETGLHRFLGFYTHLPALLRKAGINPSDVVFWEDEIEIRMPHGPRATFGLAPLFRPFKTFGSIIGNYQFLSPADKLAVLGFFSAGVRDYLFRPNYLDTRTVLQYAKEHGLSDVIIERVLIPLTEGIFFLPIQSYSAYVLFGLFVPYWKSLFKLRVGAFRGGMSEVLADPLANYIHESGGQIVLNEPVAQLTRRNGEFIKAASRTYRAKQVIVATALKAAQDIIYHSFNEPWFEPMLQLRTMPSVTFQIELTQPCMSVDRTTFGPLTCMASFAEQSRTTFRQSAGRLSVILSPPETYIQLSEESILKRVIKDARSLDIELEGKIVRYQKVVIPDDFYLLAPGAESLRPQQKTPITGLFLAGDYTKQKYMATMEGAVYSGKLCAELLRKPI